MSHSVNIFRKIVNKISENIPPDRDTISNKSRLVAHFKKWWLGNCSRMKIPWFHIVFKCIFSQTSITELNWQTLNSMNAYIKSTGHSEILRIGI